jgi:flagellar biosynthesis protein FlhF
MHLKWFKGRQMPEVMRRVREELGPEAVILHSKAARPWGPLRFLGGGGVEILAAVDRPESPPIPSTPHVQPAPTPSTETMRAELAELRTLFVRSAGDRLVPHALGAMYERLLSGGMDPALAVRILNSVPPYQADRDLGDAAGCRAVEEHMAGMIAVAGCAVTPGPLRVALVGPAGAGKTTTLAKLAARAQITGGRIAIVNADGSGFGGSGPLEPFASLLEVPYLLALTPEELAAPLPLPAARACVLIDTPGVGPDDRHGLRHLQELLRAAAPDEVHLVLSATSKAADTRAAVRTFSAMGVTHLLFTHLDETASCASVIDVCIESGLPLSFVGTGRDIPGDLDPADPRRLIRRTLQGAHIS